MRAPHWWLPYRLWLMLVVPPMAAQLWPAASVQSSCFPFASGDGSTKADLRNVRELASRGREGLEAPESAHGAAHCFGGEGIARDQGVDALIDTLVEGREREEEVAV